MVNTIYLNDAGPANDPEALAEDLANVYNTYWYNGCEMSVKLYDMADTKPREIVGEHKLNIGGFGASSGPREVALCLSFYGERNLPRTRGRIYLGMNFPNKPANAVRPQGTLREAALVLADNIAAVGGIDVDWSIYSPTTNSSHSVKTAYVDNEWDTVRSRGLRSDARSVRQINE